MPTVERARPLLGTLVTIRLAGLDPTDARRAIDAGFDEIARLHRIMSFHEPDSDVSRLNAAACLRPVQVTDATFAVLQHALAISAASRGAFDVTTACQLVQWGLLPSPTSSQTPDDKASWLDIEMGDDRYVRFRRPLWIDLGGIAKGYAVDRAIQRMALPSTVQCVVNAGGDLRVSGPQVESILLRAIPGMAPRIELQNRSIASSSGRESGRLHGIRRVGSHVHGTRRSAMGLRTFVSVIAEQCMTADALTKVVMAQGRRAVAVLRQFGAIAYRHDPRHGWQTVGTSA
jgi:thiamine biosynthesis lipoprotein